MIMEWIQDRLHQSEVKVSQRERSVLSKNISSLERAVISFISQIGEFDPVWGILTLCDLRKQYAICCEQFAKTQYIDVINQAGYFVSHCERNVYEPKGDHESIPKPKRPELFGAPQYVGKEYFRIMKIRKMLEHYATNNSEQLLPSEEDVQLAVRKIELAQSKTGIPRPYVAFYEEQPRKIRSIEKLRIYIASRKLKPEERNVPEGYWKMRMLEQI